MNEKSNLKDFKFANVSKWYYYVNTYKNWLTRWYKNKVLRGSN